jgi:pSer/pThr/pTyr-binding forkhead associated (FHA) protein
MSESHLNSIHLEPFRREAFRRARDMLLHARGNETIRAESLEDLEISRDQTGFAIQKDNPLPVGVQYYLQDKDAIYPLKIGVNTIGRMPDNDVVIEDGHVSRRHCAVLVHARNDCELYDVASKNGTFVNGQRLSGSVRLKSGDEIRMCDHPIIFVSQSESPSNANPVVMPTQ